MIYEVDEARQAAIFLLTILQALINEEISTKHLDPSVGKYLYETLREQAIKLGYLDKRFGLKLGLGVIDD
jgi:hypothetical protein